MRALALITLKAETSLVAMMIAPIRRGPWSRRRRVESKQGRQVTRSQPLNSQLGVKSRPRVMLRISPQRAMT